MISVRSVVNPFFAAHEGRRTRQEILPRFRHLLPYGRITMLSGTHKGGPYYNLLLYDRAIVLPDYAPPSVEVLGAVTERILRRQLLVDLDPPARQIAGP